MREPVSVYLGLGSNLGDRAANIKKALALLAGRLRLGRVSSIYETEPLGVGDQPRFLNLVCQAHTALEPMELLALAREVEGRLGRPPDGHNAPRPIDVDILFYGNEVVSTPELAIPHPGLTERAFVLVPLAEIAPELAHPVSSKKVRQLLEELGDTGGVVRWAGVQGGDSVRDIGRATL